MGNFDEAIKTRAPFEWGEAEKMLEAQAQVRELRNVGVGGAPTEVRVTDPNTGGQKGAKLARFSLIPADFLLALAEHYGRGAQKYEDRNWERGYRWSLTVDALHRHLAAWLGGEDEDAETGTSHLVAVAWHVVALWWFHRPGKGTDDVRRVELGIHCPQDGKADCCPGQPNTHALCADIAAGRVTQ